MIETVWVIQEDSSGILEVFATEELANEFMELFNVVSTDWEGYISESMYVEEREVRTSIQTMWSVSGKIDNFVREEAPIEQVVDHEIGGTVSINGKYIVGGGYYFFSSLTKEDLEQALADIDEYLPKIKELLEKDSTITQVEIDLRTKITTKTLEVQRPSFEKTQHLW